MNVAMLHMMTNMQKMGKALVIGGGMAGLLAAYQIRIANDAARA